MNTYLWGNVGVEVSGIFGICQIGAIRCGISVNIIPINAFEPWVGLLPHALSVRRRRGVEKTRLDHLCPITCSRSRYNEATAARLNCKGIRSENRCRRLASKTIFWFTEECFHQADALMRNMRTGGELEGLPPVQNFLASHMPLEKKKTVSQFPILCLSEPSTGDTHGVAHKWRVSTRQHTISDVNGAANHRFLTRTSIQT